MIPLERGMNGYEKSSIRELTGRAVARGMENKISKMVEHLAGYLPEAFGEEYAEVIDRLNDLIGEAGVPYEKNWVEARWYGVTISPDPSEFKNPLDHAAWIQKCDQIFTKSLFYGAFYVVEKTEAGNPHIHAYVKCKPLTYKCRVKAVLTRAMLGYKNGKQWGKERARENIVRIEENLSSRWLDYITKTCDKEEDNSWRESRGYASGYLVGGISYTDVAQHASLLGGAIPLSQDLKRVVLLDNTTCYPKSFTKLPKSRKKEDWIDAARAESGLRPSNEQECEEIEFILED